MGAIDVCTLRSLVDILKPVIDGLEPFLGRDPTGRNKFSPTTTVSSGCRSRGLNTDPL